MLTWGHFGNRVLFVPDAPLYRIFDRTSLVFTSVLILIVKPYRQQFHTKIVIRNPAVTVHNITIPAIVSFAIMSNPWLGEEPKDMDAPDLSKAKTPASRKDPGT